MKIKLVFLVVFKTKFLFLRAGHRWKMRRIYLMAKQNYNTIKKQKNENMSYKNVPYQLYA